MMNGLISLVASLFGLIQYPLTLWGAYTAMNAAFVSSIFLMYAFPAYLRKLETGEIERLEADLKDPKSEIAQAVSIPVLNPVWLEQEEDQTL
jgi:hypothetical protein